MPSATKAVDLDAPRRESDAATRRLGLRIRFYGRLAEAIGRELELDAPVLLFGGGTPEAASASSPGGRRATRSARAPASAMLVADDRRMLLPEDRVEFLPPVSGG